MKKFQTLALGVALAAVSVDLQAQIQHNGSTTAFALGAGQFWDNVSVDNGTGLCNVGHFLSTTFTADRCINESPVTAYLNAANRGITTSYIGAANTFSFAAGVYNITYFGRFAGQQAQTFTARNATEIFTFTDAVNYNVVTPVVFTSTWWLTGLTGNPIGTSRSDQLAANGGTQWAAFRAADGAFYVGFEDEFNNPRTGTPDFDYDYNDGIFRIVQVPRIEVPEPMSLALLIPAFGALAFARRRRNA